MSKRKRKKQFNNFSHKKKAGFTLLEILVVISIIGILAALGLTSYSTIQKKGRDAKRKADLKAIQNAMEQYYALNTDYGSDTDCSDQLASQMSGGEIPTDPKSVGDYIYICVAGGGGYTICADLEGDGSWDGTELDFCVRNLQ